MIIEVEGKQIRGDLIIKAIVRSDLAPIPLTLEADIRVDGLMAASLKEGAKLIVGTSPMVVIKQERVTLPLQQGGRLTDAVSIIAVLDGAQTLSHVRRTSVVKEKALFSECLKSCGCRLSIDGDFTAPRFTVLIGFIPTYQLSMVLQEEGRVMHWDARSKKITVTRLNDFKNKKPITGIQAIGAEEVHCEFLERHSVPWFYSIGADAKLIYGNQDKPRNTHFVPKKTEEQLYSMSRALVLVSDVRISFSGAIQAGDVVQSTSGKKLVVMTAAHVFKSGTDGSEKQEDYTRLWLGEVK